MRGTGVMSNLVDNGWARITFSVGGLSLKIFSNSQLNSSSTGSSSGTSPSSICLFSSFSCVVKCFDALPLGVATSPVWSLWLLPETGSWPACEAAELLVLNLLILSIFSPALGACGMLVTLSCSAGVGG